MRACRAYSRDAEAVRARLRRSRRRRATPRCDPNGPVSSARAACCGSSSHPIEIALMVLLAQQVNGAPEMPYARTDRAPARGARNVQGEFGPRSGQGKCCSCCSARSDADRLRVRFAPAACAGLAGCRSGSFGVQGRRARAASAPGAGWPAGRTRVGAQVRARAGAQQPSCSGSGGKVAPGCGGAQHGVEGDQHLAHEHDQGELGRLAVGERRW